MMHLASCQANVKAAGEALHLQRGSQPSLACHTNSCSWGTLALMCSLWRRYALMQASLSDMVSSPNSQTSHHLPIACRKTVHSPECRHESVPSVHKPR